MLQFKAGTEFIRVKVKMYAARGANRKSSRNNTSKLKLIIIIIILLLFWDIFN